MPNPLFSGVRISLLDSTIVLVYLLCVTALGLWIGRGNRNTSDYLLGDRKLPWWAVLGSIVATETSTVTFLSVPGLTYAAGGDFGFLQLSFGYLIGRTIVAQVFLPLYFRGTLFTAYEVLNTRFGGVAQKAASLIFLMTRNLSDGLRLFLTAIVVEKVTGASLTTSILIVGVCTIAYTLVGGMKAVVWSDCLQFLIYVGGGISALILMVSLLPDGWSQLFRFAEVHGKFRLWNTTLDFSREYTVWSGVIGGALLTFGTHGTDQMMVQRYLCTGSHANAAKALIASGFVVLLQFSLFLLIGVGLAAFYADGPADSAPRQGEAFITFIVDRMPVGLVGLTVAAVFSAAMSTLSSSLNSSAGAVITDLLPRQESAARDLRRTRLLTLFFGILQTGIAVAAARTDVDRTVVNDVLAVAGFSSGILTGVFALGVFTKRVGQCSAMSGMITGAVVLCVVKFGTSIAWPWFSLIGAATTFCAGLLISLVHDRRQW